MSASVDRPAPASLLALRYALLLLAAATALYYFQWRTGVFNPAHPVYSWIVFVAELIGFARTFLFLLVAVRVPYRGEVPVAPPGLTVDVFIPTFNEPINVVRRTALAALAIAYPHETWILDDGERAEMRDLATAIGCRYLARTEHSDTKAGNLNHALARSHGEFVTVFDADHVAHPRFLERTLGYFGDERLAFVQTPQELFNTDSFDHLRTARTTSNGASFFHRVIQRSRDASNSTIYSGSSGVLRRRALDEIGGFATGTISEDVHTSFRLHAAGWGSVFHPEILSAGIGPLNAAAYCAQRLRWSQDTLQLLLCENLLAHPALTWRQRLAYLIHAASNLEGWRHIFIYALPIAILLTGIVPLQTAAQDFLLHFLPYFLAINVAVSEFARGHLRVDESAVYNLARAPASILAVFTAHGAHRWRVTPKVPGPATRAPEMRFAEALLLLSSAAIAFACLQSSIGRSHLDRGALAIVVVWAAYHVATAGRLLTLERRCARDRRATTRFGEHLPATIRRADEPQAVYAVDVVAASADGLTLQTRDRPASPAGGTYNGVLETKTTHYTFTIELADRRGGGRVIWPDDATRIAFDQYLHQRAIERFGATDRGDRGGIFRTAEALVRNDPEKLARP
jgi:cellulose synthase (UDP-forming)